MDAAIGSTKKATAMGMYLSDSSERMPRKEISATSIRPVDEAQPPKLSEMALHPTVSITPAGPVRRLGIGCCRWFSESVHVPVGNRLEFRFQGSRHLLALYSEGARKGGETSIDGLFSSKLRGSEHKLTFVPAGQAYREWHETASSAQLTFIYFDPAALRASDGSDAEFAPRIYFEDPRVWETAFKLKKAIESGDATCVPYLEALCGVLAYELSRSDREAVREVAPVSRGGLAGWQKRIVVEYVEEHLGEQVCLLKLAQLAKLSIHHFCRAFKRSFGMPAYQYQVQRRMELAKLRLADRGISITDIALGLGYAQTSSFSSAFRKTTGWTPTDYRREFK
ncbi:AraC family transcriptional regulator [Bradyrhizobium sp. CCGB01]|uniref:helix-turn-helix domain-containing protein n=1 Tax=Bradyrhizobium sp. CCGB01 TaxID=2949634 RepID=UPI0020B433FC|nr:AraC family transcriptional regulator [Bradyrhizobium sp. CCGB01]MCP3411225.1 AraC family transcriptional regulator [Bradyrhizobium sp. CCGB01]